MADNLRTARGDTIRTKTRGAPHTQVMGLDLNVGGSQEVLATVSLSSATPVAVPGTTTPSTSLLPANVNRLGGSIANASTANLFLAHGATCTTSLYRVKLAAGAVYTIPSHYRGEIRGVWDAVNGNAIAQEDLP